MPGLLDKIGGAIKNPTLQGLGGAAALGFNPLIGLLAVPSLRGNKRKKDAQEELTKLLSSTSNVQGPSRIARSELDGSALGTIPGKKGQVPAMQTPQGQARAMGLLSQANPQAFSSAMAQGLFSQQQERAAPADIRIMDALGLPRTPEGYARLQDMKSKTGGSMEEMLSMLLVEERQERLRREKKAEEQADKDRRVQFETGESSLNQSLRGLEDLAGYNDSLEGTFLRSGAFAEGRELAFETFESLKSTLGGDTEEERKLLEDVDLFKKGAANLLLDLLPKLEGINARTDNRLDQIKSSIADLGTQPGANRKIMADIIDELLSIAKVEGFTIDNRGHFAELSKSLRKKKTSGSRDVVMPDGSVIKNVPPNVSDDQVKFQYMQRR